ncbi:CopL family metal-binding regulatory protein [Arenimonas oryziterrae]|uniref:CopL family metal-binding regulatory protein n=1 Tax=Arenimonas oryziterrae TaxID=498055 RepID=UPI0012DDB38F
MKTLPLPLRLLLVLALILNGSGMSLLAASQGPRLATAQDSPAPMASCHHAPASSPADQDATASAEKTPLPDTCCDGPSCGCACAHMASLVAVLSIPPALAAPRTAAARFAPPVLPSAPIGLLLRPPIA